MTPRTPLLTVDVLVELAGAPGKLVFVERRNPPHGYALPGGFVDPGEWAVDAAVREAKEETGLDVEPVELFHVYSDPARDPRSPTISIVYIARASGTPTAGDDAARCVVSDPDALSLVFDHATIVADYLTYRRTGQRPPPRR